MFLNSNVLAKAKGFRMYFVSGLKPAPIEYFKTQIISQIPRL